MIQYIKGDITEVTSGLVLHGTNCTGGFGSGVAGAIRKKWPKVYANFCLAGTGAHLLGKFKPTEVTEELTVANCYTQMNFGSDGRRYASPQAVEQALFAAYEYAQLVGIKTVHLPKIGCGLGGLSWEDEIEPIVSAIIEDYSDIETKVYYID